MLGVPAEDRLTEARRHERNYSLAGRLLPPPPACLPVPAAIGVHTQRMRRITGRNQSGPPDPEAYWRRRFIILGGGLGALMLAAWAFASGGPSPAASRTAAARASLAARQARSSLPSAAYGKAWTPARPATPAPGPAATVAGLTLPRASPTATRPAKAAAGTVSPSAAPGSSAASGSAGGAGARCAPGSFVLSLFTSASAYRPAQQPRFDVYAVSTSSSACEMPFGPAAARVVVTHDGQVVWDSAACEASRPAPAPDVRFVQGVPAEVTLSWNPAARTQGCAGSLARGESGTFEAVAMADGISSKAESFTLQP